jgi:hypothetical protein
VKDTPSAQQATAYVILSNRTERRNPVLCHTV